MERDIKVGLVLGVLLVAIVAVVFFRRQPQVDPVQLASQTQEPIPDELPVIRTRPSPYHVSTDYLREVLAPRLQLQPSPRQSQEPPAEAPAEPVVQEPAILPSLQSPPPEPPVLQAEPRPGGQYVVKKGDTLASISRQAYGTEAHYRLIYEANRDVLVSPNELPVGVLIRIPKIDTATPHHAAPRQEREQETAAPEGRRRTYRVRPGDTLRSIARRIYGDERMYRRIFRANRDQLASPADLKPGMVLRLP